jgi:hypothetical protein
MEFQNVEATVVQKKWPNGACEFSYVKRLLQGLKWLGAKVSKKVKETDRQTVGVDSFL